MHANNIIHRDIKANNILISNLGSKTSENPKRPVLKLADLGESSVLSSWKFIKGKIVGTPLFLAPEVIKHENYDHRVDIWALGCVLYHLAALEPPFTGGSQKVLLNAIQYKNPKPLGLYSKNLRNFINKMLEKQKIKRPFILDLFKMFPSNYKIERETREDKEEKWIFRASERDVRNLPVLGCLSSSFLDLKLWKIKRKWR